MAQMAPSDARHPSWKDELARAQTPRGADGKPDLNGMWKKSESGQSERFGQTLISSGSVDEKGNVTAGYGGRGSDKSAAEQAQGFIDYQRDSGVSLRSEPNMPLYKPEHWERVQWLDENGNKEDPELVCKPYGVPRMGPPDRIVQTPKELFFFYSSHNTFRVIPMNKPLPPQEQWEGTSWNGTSSAHWDGDTLVIENVDFTEESWLGFPGYFHTVEMRVTERYSRQGNVLTYQATVDDPGAFLQPWVMNPWYLKLENANPIGEPKETLPCGDYTFQHVVTKERG